MIGSNVVTANIFFEVFDLWLIDSLFDSFGGTSQTTFSTQPFGVSSDSFQRSIILLICVCNFSCNDLPGGASLSHESVVEFQDEPPCCFDCV